MMTHEDLSQALPIIAVAGVLLLDALSTRFGMRCLDWIIERAGGRIADWFNPNRRYRSQSSPERYRRPLLGPRRDRSSEDNNGTDRNLPR